MENFKEIVDYLSNLAHLKLSSEEKELLAGQLSAILDAAAKVSELPTEGVKPTSHVIDLPGVFRDDSVLPSLPVKEVLKDVPITEEGYFKVPKMARGDQ